MSHLPPDAISDRTDAFSTLAEFLNKQPFCDAVVFVVKSTLAQFHSSRLPIYPLAIPLDALDVLGTMLHGAFVSQSRLGWSNFLPGRISSKWLVSRDY